MTRLVGLICFVITPPAIARGISAWDAADRMSACGFWMTAVFALNLGVFLLKEGQPQRRRRSS